MARIISRTVLLYLLGMPLSMAASRRLSKRSGFSVSCSRIALCYGITATLFLFLRPKALLVAVGILLGYWALLALVPAPGEPSLQLCRGATTYELVLIFTTCQVGQDP